MYIRLLRGSHNSLKIEQHSEKTNLGLRFIHVCLHFRLRFWQRGGKFKSLIILLIIDSPVNVKNTAALELEETRFLR